MNRSMLIIITDFLLLSLLTFANFEEVRTPEQRTVPASSGLNPPLNLARDGEVMDVLKMSLEQERAAREGLTSKLSAAEEALRTRESLVADSQKKIAESEQSLRQRDLESRNLEKGRLLLQQQLSAAQTNFAMLQQQLAETATDAKIYAARADAFEADLRKRQDEAERLKRQMEELEKKRLAAEADRQRLSGQLQVAETEKRLTREQLEAARNEVQVARREVQVVRGEKAQLHEQTTKLTQGVSELAKKSGELTKEIRENRPLAPNAMFSDFRTNRIETTFKAGRSGVFGQSVSKEKVTKTLLVSDGALTFAIFHVDDTPLALTTPGMDWRELTGTLRRNRISVPMGRLLFLDSDPRIVVVPVPASEAAKLRAKTYSITKEPFKFQDAMLVGADEGYYGECKFQIDPEMPQYVRMHRGLFSRLAGNFAPSTGDLVLSKTGDLLGVMVNKQYCLVLSHLNASQGMTAGVNLTNQPTAKLLSQLHSRIGQLPFKLQ